MLKPLVKRPHVSAIDRLFWILFSKYVDGWLAMLHALHPDTVVRWHREGFRRYWSRKSRRQRRGADRPSIPKYASSSDKCSWQIAERVIGSIRRDCLAHVIVFNERHLRRILRGYVSYYHTCRTHLSLDKDSPDTRVVEPPESGNIVALPRVGGLHHCYARVAA